MLSCWALLVLGVSSRPPDASTHAPHGRGLRASGTAAFLTEEEQLQAGVKPETLRICVGIEHFDDILADLEQALAAA